MDAKAVLAERPLSSLIDLGGVALQSTVPAPVLWVAAHPPAPLREMSYTPCHDVSPLSIRPPPIP